MILVGPRMPLPQLVGKRIVGGACAGVVLRSAFPTSSATNPAVLQTAFRFASSNGASAGVAPPAASSTTAQAEEASPTASPQSAPADVLEGSAQMRSNTTTTTAEKHVTDDDPAPLGPGSRRDLGDILKGDEAYAEAQRIKFAAQREALEMHIKTEQEAAAKEGRLGKGGRHTEKTLSLIARLAEVHRDFGRFDDEREMLEELAAAAVDVKGKESVVYLASISRLAACHARMKQHAKRLELLEGTRELLPKVFTTRADVPQVCAAMHNLADAYEANARFEEQVDCLAKVVEAQDELHGVDSDEVMSTTVKLTDAYINLGAYPNVVELLESRLPPLIARLTAIHPQIFVAWMHLAVAYGHVGRREDQLGLYEALFEIGEDVFKSDLHPMMLVMRRNRAIAHIIVRHKTDAALDELADVVHSFGQQLGPRDPETYMALHALADSFARTGRLEDSLQAYDELIRRVRQEGMAGGLEDIVSQRKRVADALAAAARQKVVKEEHKASTDGAPSGSSDSSS